MIQGYNIKLKKPSIILEDKKLLKNDEIREMLERIDRYFEQENTIYDAHITITNNEYIRKYNKFGSYNKRIEETINLRHLTKITLYEDRITLNTTDETITMPVGKNFIWFCEWEKAYYL